VGVPLQQTALTQPRPAVPHPPATGSRGPARHLPVVAQDRTDPTGAATGTRSTAATAQPGRGTTRTALAYLRSCGGKSCLGVSRWRPPLVQNAGSDLTGDIERVKKIMPAKLVLRGSTRPLSGQGARAHERLLFETAGCSDTRRLPSMRVAAGSGASRTDSQRDARAHLRRDRRPSGPNEDACNRDARRSEPRTGCRAGLADDAQTSPRLSRPGEECGLEVAGLAVRGSPGPLAGRRSP